MKLGDTLKSLLLLGQVKASLPKKPKTRDKEREDAAKAKRQRKALKRLQGRK